AAACTPVFGLGPIQRTVWCSIPRSRASHSTPLASRFDSGRKPWSTVTAMSFGGVWHAVRQRAAKTISAVESGPPETARTSIGRLSRALKSLFASAAETGAVSETGAASAADTLLFPLDALL